MMRVLGAQTLPILTTDLSVRFETVWEWNFISHTVNLENSWS